MEENLLIIISLIVGLLGTSIIQALKNAFALEDKKALALSLAISIVLGLLTAWGNGLLHETPLTPIGVSGVMAMVFGWATVFYKALLANKQ